MSVYLVTGGTGTIGSAVVRRLLASGDDDVVVFSRDEDKQHKMKMEFRNDRLHFQIGDVRDYYSVDKAMKIYRPEYVFHAAAMKHVPFCEDFVLEGVKTNVLGSNNVFDAAISNGVKKVVFLSTDKAVEPSCIMGMSKAIAEKLIDEKVKYANGTVFCATRFGNIIRSRGSVVLVFEEQIREGKPLTITDPYMTRFIMSVDEAVDLVMYAFENGKQGDLFVYHAKSCMIYDLATAVEMINGAKCEHVVIGNRGNEKMHESLLSEEEMAHSKFNGKFYVVNKAYENEGDSYCLRSDKDPINISEIIKYLV